MPESEIDPSNLLLIVVGASLRAEVADRPLAYQLRDSIKAWVQKQKGWTHPPVAPLVCSDIFYMNNEPLHRRPTISLGGPGVNALSAYFADKLNAALIRENRIVIQLDPEFVDLRACIWGMNHQLTVDAVTHFEQHYLQGYLRAVATQVEPKEE